MQKEDRIVPESDKDKQVTSTSERKRRLVVIMNCTGVVFALAILVALIALTRYREIFSTTMKAFDLRNPSLNHPQKPYTISGRLNVIISAVIVFLVIINWFYWERRTLKHHLFGILCTVYLATLGACFMILLVNCTKNLAGNLRPFFLSACNPNISLVAELKAKNTTWVDEDMSKIICTNKQTLKYRWSFPSGHSAEAFYSVILSILIIQYTKNIRTRYSESASLVLPLKATIQFILFAFACWVGITRTLDEHHFWWDVLAGSLLGSFMATVTFFWFLKPVMENTKQTDWNYCRANCSCCGIRPSSYEGVSVKDEELQPNQ